MPAAPRSRGKARKIFIKIMGIPENARNVKSPKKTRVNKRLVFEETNMAR